MAKLESTDSLREEYNIDTPENVTFGYEVAGIGSRFIGALIDSFTLVVSLIVLSTVFFAIMSRLGGAGSIDELLAPDTDWQSGLSIALFALLQFIIFWGYFILFELVWNGQTPGKRVAKTRVVRVDGNPAGALEIVVRNLVRIVDFLPGAYAIGLIVMFLNDKARRLGDYAAGTMVIREQSEIKLDSLSQVRRPTALPAAEDDPLLTRYVNVRRLSVTDYELIRESLRRHNEGTVSTDILRRLALALAAKLEVPAPEPHWTASRQFLNEVAEAYRRYR